MAGWRSGWVLVCLLVCLSGCGRPKVAVHGDVTYANEPILDGVIRYYPLDGTPGYGAATKIENGRYALSPKDGLVAGTYLVEITATKETGRTEPRMDIEPGESPTIREIIQYIPKRYNTESEIRVELSKPDQVRSFELQQSPQ